MLKALPGILLSLSTATSSFAAPVPSRLTGDWIMNLYIGSQVFADEVTVRPGPGGESGGSLTVPGRFTAPLEAIHEGDGTFSFEITADEGRGPFRIHYEGRFHGADDVFVGFATFVDPPGRLLGGFVGRRQEPVSNP